MAIAYPNALFTLAIRAAHDTTPADVYLTTKQVAYPTFATNGSVAPLVPSALYSVNASRNRPVTNTLPFESVAIPYPMSVLVFAPVICAAHTTTPVDEYFATKISEPPVKGSVVPVVPPILYSVAAVS